MADKGSKITYGGKGGFIGMPGQASVWTDFLRSQAGDDGNSATDGGACSQ
jgi:hypothetical protein